MAELRQLRESYEVKIKEYEELMDIRIQLDQEITTYRALLHEEETRSGHSVGSLLIRTPLSTNQDTLRAKGSLLIRTP